MPWHDDSWRDGYDAWKLASPDDDGAEADYCEHDEYDIDILEGRATCSSCGEHWDVSTDELEAELYRLAYYEADFEREMRRQWWRDFFARITHPVRWPIYRLLQWLRFRKSHAVLLDDEIPF